MKTYLQGLITGILLGISSLMFIGSKFSGFKNINDVYSSIIEIQDDIDYIKKWGVECNGGSIDEIDSPVDCD